MKNIFFFILPTKPTTENLRGKKYKKMICHRTIDGLISNNAILVGKQKKQPSKYLSMSIDILSWNSHDQVGGRGQERAPIFCLFRLSFCLFSLYLAICLSVSESATTFCNVFRAWALSFFWRFMKSRWLRERLNVSFVFSVVSAIV